MIDYNSAILIFCVCIISAYIIIPSKLEISKRVILMLALTLSGVTAYRSINDRAGLPTPLPPMEEEVLVIGFLPEKDSGLIYIWIKIEEGETPKTFAFTYDENTKKRLQGLRKKHRGKPYYAKVKSGKKKGKGLTRYGDMNTWLQIEDEISPPKKD